MNRYLSMLVRHLSTFVLLATTTLAAQATDHAGRWKGAIELLSGQLEITVALTPGNDPAWTGTIDIPAQGLRGFELSGVTVEGARLHFEMGGIPGQPTFDGALSESRDAIAGTFRQGSQTLPFSLRRTATEATAQDSAETPLLPAKPVPGEGAAGEWLGALDVGPVKLRLALHVEKGGDGGLGAMLDSLDQGAKIPVDTVVFERGTLRLALEAIGATYVGALNADGSALEGVWSQGGRELPLTFHRLEGSARSGPDRP